MIPQLRRKQTRTKEPLDESEKFGLKLNIQKTKILASGPITPWQIDVKQWKQVLHSHKVSVKKKRVWG